MAENSKIKTHAVGSRTAEGVTHTVCGKAGRRRFGEFEQYRILHTGKGVQIQLHQIGVPPTCKLCVKHSKFQDWSL